MNAEKAVIIIDIIKMLCPELKRIAASTDNNYDNAVVEVLCGIVSWIPDTVK